MRRRAMQLAAAKLPIKTKFATRFARGEGVMKAAEIRELSTDELQGSGKRAGRSAVPAAHSEVDGDSSRRRAKVVTLRRDLARIKTILRERTK
jgi:ribosomal protein L29